MEWVARVPATLSALLWRRLPASLWKGRYVLLANSNDGKVSHKRCRRSRVCWGVLVGIVAAAALLILLNHRFYVVREDGHTEAVFGPHWTNYPILTGYNNGLETMVDNSDYVPEYPNITTTNPPESSTAFEHKWSPFRPSLDDHNGAGNKQQPMKPCYLDLAGKIEVPDLYAYSGIPQSQPLPAMGSRSLFPLRDDICFDRYGRYGMYGLGYGVDEGGTGEGLLRDSGQTINDIWKTKGRIDYRRVDWGNVQERCYASNQHRFSNNKNERSEPGKPERQAVVVRVYTGYSWTQEAILNMRALISETSLKSGGEYTVHILLHVQDENIPIWTDESVRQEVLDKNVPKEFHTISTLWSQAQMRLYYPGDFGHSASNPSGFDLHSVHRSAHMPLQHFAVHHPEYAHFWNWEADIRYIGSYLELFSRLGDWAAKQSRIGSWERSARYYIPTLHGSWEDFTETVFQDLQRNGQKPIVGPVEFPDGKVIKQALDDFIPQSCKDNIDSIQCGVGEPADLITLNPQFEAERSDWMFCNEVTGYDLKSGLPPRRATLVTAARMSRRLLYSMHNETWKMHHSMFTEMFPPSIALHYGLKSVFAPHPIYVERDWPLQQVEDVFNGGEGHTAGGLGSPFGRANEHNFFGTSWYYHAQFAGRLWRHWFRGEVGEDESGKTHTEPDIGSRLCLRSMLFHPVKQ